jgi:energy-coupling factor transport system ATP-binding protein
VLSEHRVGRALDLADRVIFVEGGRIALDAPVDEAAGWLAERAPQWAPDGGVVPEEMPSGGGATVVEMENVSFSYRAAVPVLRGASLVVRRGEIVALEGPNGTGKTTLAKVASGLLQPATGRVALEGRAGYVVQDPGRYVVCENVLDEVALGVDGDSERARGALAAFDLAWAAERHPRDLSSGQRQRLALAAVAVAEPDLLVVDEPTRGMDPAHKASLGEWLRAYAAGGGAALVATHDRSLPAHRRVVLGGRGAGREVVGVG